MTSFLDRLASVVPSRLLREFIALTVVAWGGVIVVVAGIAIGIDLFSTVTVSVWEHASGIIRWYALFIGAYLVYDRLPLYIAHGQTRREFATRGAGFVVIFATVMAVLVAVGFLLEAMFYSVRDWPQSVSDDHLFSTARQLHLILPEYWLIFLTWTLVGTLLGAGFYRSEGIGALAIAPAIVIVAFADLAFGASWGPLGRVVERLFDPESTPLPVAIGLIVIGLVTTVVLTWKLVADMPLRTAKA